MEIVDIPIASFSSLPRFVPRCFDLIFFSSLKVGTPRHAKEVAIMSAMNLIASSFRTLKNRKTFVSISLLLTIKSPPAMAIPRIYSSSLSFFSSISRNRHDVFLSFRGEDTRHGVTSQLHKALEDAGIPTFKDDKNLEKGSEIAAELLSAIQASRIAVVIFSRNYATSRWCLDELLKIIECRDEAGQVVLPVFYDVVPSDVLNQTNSYGRAFDKHEERFRSGIQEKNKVERWRAALTEAASSLHGWDLQNCASRHQSKFVEEIVKHILGRRQDAHMSASLSHQQ
ncbi:hypothetical protein NMG60_11006331 [Bertholletia excelsa]